MSNKDLRKELHALTGEWPSKLIGHDTLIARITAEKQGRHVGGHPEESNISEIASNEPETAPPFLQSEAAKTGTVSNTDLGTHPIHPTENVFSNSETPPPPLEISSSAWTGVPSISESKFPKKNLDAAALTESILTAVKFGDAAALQAALTPVLNALNSAAGTKVAVGVPTVATNEGMDDDVAAEARGQNVLGVLPDVGNRLESIPIAACSEEQVRESVKSLVAMGMKVTLGAAWWEFRFKDRVDSGTMHQPLYAIRKCADLVMRESVSANRVFREG